MSYRFADGTTETLERGGTVLLANDTPRRLSLRIFSYGTPEQPTDVTEASEPIPIPPRSAYSAQIAVDRVGPDESPRERIQSRSRFEQRGWLTW